MKKNAELLNILKAELTLLTQGILQNVHQDNFNDLYKSSRKLYEKMAAIKQLQNKIDEAELIKIITKKEAVQNIAEDEIFISEEIKETEKPEILPVKKEKTTEKTDVKNSDILDKYKDVSQMKFTPKETASNTNEPQNEVVKQTEKPDITRQSATKKMSIGLNDRISFINNLFDGDSFAYSQYIDKLNAFADYETALKYIYTEIKPNYNNWTGKEEFEFRLLQLLEIKFN